MNNTKEIIIIPTQYNELEYVPDIIYYVDDSI